MDAKRRSPEKRLADALDYTVETTIARDTDLAGTTTLRFKTLVPKLRVLPVHLLPLLAPPGGLLRDRSRRCRGAGLEAARLRAGRGEGGRRPRPWSSPSPWPRGRPCGCGSPTRGTRCCATAATRTTTSAPARAGIPTSAIFSDPALFDLTYRVPAGNEISRWARRSRSGPRASRASRTGRPSSPCRSPASTTASSRRLDKQDETSKIDVEVFTNPGTPDIIRRSTAISAVTELSRAPRGGYYARWRAGTQPGQRQHGPAGGGIAGRRPQLGPALHRLLRSAAADPRGHHPAVRLRFGQSWPSLIFLPYIAFLDGTQRQRLGLVQAKDFVDQVGYHEFAHQWWGHLVGAETYRDQWLEEGFSEFSAALAVQRTQGWPEYDRFWRERAQGDPGEAPGQRDGPSTRPDRSPRAGASPPPGPPAPHS